MSHEGSRILVVDDDPVACELLREVFEREGFLVRCELCGEAALAALRVFRPEVVVSDIRMKSREDGLNLLDHARRESPDTPVILMTAFGSIDTAVRAVKQGAFDYVSKPFKMDAIVGTVCRALSARAGAQRTPPASDTEEAEPVAGLVGRDPQMLEIYMMIGRVSDARAAVLITGESGTGKELIARAIHTHGKRHAEPFVAVNCGALTETLLESELFGHVKGSFTGAVANKRGIFEQAKGGTVFLDEIGETSPALQVKLLRVLQEREIVPVGGSAPVEVRARVIAASNADLDALCERGEFRRDLLFRLNVINIHLPPLRERRDDIPLLVAHMLRKHTPEEQPPPAVDDDALARLAAYSWPGNIRELENIIERAITLNRSGRIGLGDLPRKVLTGESAEVTTLRTHGGEDPTGFFEGIPTIDELERRHLLRVLEVTGGNKKRAAEILGINRRTLYRMAERFGIEI
jgi:two-component system, NtrC family, response regulator AtoC